MGSRADFYVGRGKNAEWIGSIAWDGYSVPDSVSNATDEDGYRKAVADLLASREDGTKPEQGWPWPWADSGTTDYAYALDGGKVWECHFGSEWWDAAGDEPEEPKEDQAVFPNMSERQAVTYGKRSGVILVGS